ncbi:TadE/TadG family type IV pilus assembly protein [Burkholderia ubonensis]|uniref:TadE/TadG family type IV pilus assembly protein n=1 Tax=Burkholderia ubonensis TaxID=101571 RepID=UPI001E3AFD95|nr:TadE/TadG family type IV pilus assembly protein [Burkholderia ubonensis]
MSAKKEAPAVRRRMIALMAWIVRFAQKCVGSRLGRGDIGLSSSSSDNEIAIKSKKGQTTYAGSEAMRSRKERGAAAVEFALVLPLLLTVTFGAIEFGIAIYDKAVVTNASREAARYGVVLASPKYTAAQIQQVAASYCSTYMISFGGSNACSSSNVAVTGAQGSLGTPLSVTISYKFVPLALGKLISPLTGPLTISATTTMNNE